MVGAEASGVDQQRSALVTGRSTGTVPRDEAPPPQATRQRCCAAPAARVRQAMTWTGGWRVGPLHSVGGPDQSQSARWGG